jgi:hypothetical protein
MTTPQHLDWVVAHYAQHHLTPAERNEAYAAAVRMGESRGISHLQFLPVEQLHVLRSKGISVPTIHDATLPYHEVDERACPGSHALIVNDRPEQQCASCDRTFCRFCGDDVLCEEQKCCDQYAAAMDDKVLSTTD